MSHRVTFALALAASAFLWGCACQPKAPVIQDTIKYTVDDTGRVAFSDPATKEAILCTGLQERFTTENKLDVIANVKNRSDRPLKVQVQCLFRDADGFMEPEGTPWQSVSLEPQATETVHFTAASTIPKRYTLRFRQAR